MSWYVIQTYTGNEEKLVEMIRRIVPQQYYDECFVIYYEQLRHRRQENQVHILRLFPGYIFIFTDSIGQLFQYLKKVPTMSKIMTVGAFAFTPLCDGEAEFLLNIMDADHIVRLSYVATDGRNHVSYLSGPLEQCREQIQAYRFNKRYAVVRLLLEGEEKEAKLGIILNDDIRREIAYGKVEAVVERTERYTIPALTRDPKEKDPKAKSSREKDLKDKNSGGNDLKERNSEKRDFEEIAEKTGKKVDGRADNVSPDARSDELELRPSQGILRFAPGDKVLVMEGAFEGSVAAVSQMKKDVLRIFVQLFGREIQAEVPMGSVKKIG